MKSENYAGIIITSLFLIFIFLMLYQGFIEQPKHNEMCETLCVGDTITLTGYSHTGSGSVCLCDDPDRMRMYKIS